MKKLKLALFIFSLFALHVSLCAQEGFYIPGTFKFTSDHSIPTDFTFKVIWPKKPIETVHRLSFEISPEVITSVAGISLSVAGAVLMGYASYGMTSGDDSHQDKYQYARNTGVVMFVSGLAIPLATHAISYLSNN